MCTRVSTMAMVKSPAEDIWAELHAFRRDTMQRAVELQKKIQRDTHALPELNNALDTLKLDAKYKLKQLLVIYYFENKYHYYGLCNGTRARRSAESTADAQRQACLQQALFGGIAQPPSLVQSLSSQLLDESSEGEYEEEEDEAIRLEEERCRDVELPKCVSLGSVMAKRVAATETNESFKIRVVEAHRRRNKARISSRRGVPRSYPEAGEELAPMLEFDKLPRDEEPQRARAITRTALLEEINNFLAECEEETIDKRDMFWSQWFLRQYLEIDPKDLESSKLLLLEERVDRLSNTAVLSNYRNVVLSSSASLLQPSTFTSAPALDATASH